MSRRTGRGAAAVPRSEPEAAAGRRLTRWVRGVVFDHLGLKVLALVLTLTAFLAVGSSDETRQIRAPVAVRYLLPEGKVLVSDRIDEVHLTIEGPWRRIKRFDERELDPITIDAGKRSGEVQLTADMVDVPAGLRVTAIAPRMVRVVFENRVSKRVEVAAALIGRAAAGYAVVPGAIVVEPSTVVVRGAETVVSAMSQVRTEDVAIDGRAGDFEFEARLRAPEGVEIDWKGTVWGKVPITGRRVGTAAVVAMVGGVASARFAIKPREVEVELIGASAAIERLLATGLRPTVEVPRSLAGMVRAQVAVDGVPSGVQVVVRPPEVEVRARR